MIETSNARAAARGFERFGFRVTVVSSLAAGALLYAGAGLVATETGHSTAPLSHAWWIVPLMATALFCAGVMRAGGSVLLANLTTGAVRNAVALLIGYSLFRATGRLGSVGAIQAVAAAVALGLGLQLATLLRDTARVSGPADITDRRDWLRTSMQMGYAGLSRVIIAAIVVIVLRVFVGEVAAGAFHLATAWAVWATIPGLVLAAVAGRHVAAASADSWISLVRRSVRLAIVPTVVVAALTLGVAHLALAGGGESQLLARELLVPVILIAMLRSMAFVVGSGLSFGGRSAVVAWLLTAMWLAIAIGSAVFATAVGLLAAAWWVVVVYVLALAALFTRLR